MTSQKINARATCIQPEHRAEFLASTMYHYTSPEAFRAIVQQKKLRFTDIRFLNDKSESKYFVEMLDKFLSSRPGRYPHIEDCFHRMLNGRDPREISNIYDEDFFCGCDTSIHSTQPRCFVFCTSTQRDCLNMWNYYVNNNAYQGYNIGFRMGRLLEAFETGSRYTLPDGFTVKYGRVVYEESEQFRLLDALCKNVEDKLPRLEAYPHTPADISAWNQWLIQREIDSYAAFFKPPAFQAENEFRIALVVDVDEIPYKEPGDKYSDAANDQIMEGFCCKQGLIVPYLQMALPEQSIDDITVAPIMEFELARRGVQELLTAAHVVDDDGVAVYRSDIPIRF